MDSASCGLTGSFSMRRHFARSARCLKTLVFPYAVATNIRANRAKAEDKMRVRSCLVMSLWAG